MVLETASASPEADSFSDSIPASDEDPYSGAKGGGGTTLRYHIDVSSLPKPIPILGPLFGYNNELFTKVFQEKIKNGHNALQRAPTQDEAAAFAFWTAKQISIFSYGTPVGLAGGFWRAWGTKATFRFPFWQPNLDKFQSGVFPHPSMPLLRDNRAMLVWHGLRMLAYGAVGKYIGQILLGSYSMTIAAVGELSDPRLKEIVNAIRQKGQRKQGRLPSPVPTGTVGGAQRGGIIGMERNERPDDASPTGGMYGNERGFDGVPGRGTVTDDMRQDEGEDSDETNPGNWPRPGYPQSQTENTKASPQIQERETPKSQSDQFDDASPTGGHGIRADKAEPSGSAWERIRRGSKPGGQSNGTSWTTNNQEPTRQGEESAWSKLQNNTQQEQRQGSTRGDSFAFSKTEEERSLAKSEAQKEFDARVERERRGGDFNSGGGDQRRW